MIIFYVFIKVEIMVPGPKVGLIIGKGGETIKQLQEKSGAKMVVIQDGPSQENEKPLRITGEPQKVEVNFLFSVDIALKCKCEFYYFSFYLNPYLECNKVILALLFCIIFLL